MTDLGSQQQILFIFQVCAGLLAFTLTFYALLARERKAPYITHTAISACILTLLTFVIALIGFYLPSNFATWRRGFLWISNFMLLVSAIYILWKICKINNRLTNLRDDRLFRQLGPVREVRSLFSRLRGKPTWEHNTSEFPKEDVEAIRRVIAEATKDGYTTYESAAEGLRTVAFFLESHAEATRVLLPIVKNVLERGHDFQYMCVSRHPKEFMERLRDTIPDDRWRTQRKQIVVIDGYTPHFGFTDSTHVEWTRKLTADLQCVSASSSFAGLHSAAAKAFNLLKKNESGKPPRKPALVIYEGSYAMVDLESVEQYRIFIRHVIPSERLWGGMFTVFIETAISDDARKILRSYADITIEKGVK